MSGFREKKNLFAINNKQLAFVSIMGGLASAMNNAGFYLPLIGPFKLNPRWIFSLLSAVWCGPTAGILVGFIAAIHIGAGIDLLSGPATHFLVGLIARQLRTHGRSGVWAVLILLLIGIPSDVLIARMIFNIPFEISLFAVSIPIVAVCAFSIVLGLAIEKRLHSYVALLE